MTDPEWGQERKDLLVEILAEACADIDSLQRLAKPARLIPGTFPRSKDVRSTAQELIDVLCGQRLLDRFVRLAAREPTISHWHDRLLALGPAPGLQEAGAATSVLTDDERADVARLLDQLDDADCLPDESEVALIVWSALGHVGRMELAASQDLHTMIDLLDRRICPGESMPDVLTFLEHLAVYEGLQGRAEHAILLRLLDDVAKRRNVSETDRRRVQEQAAAAESVTGRVLAYIVLYEEDSLIRPKALVYRKETKTYFVYQAEAVYEDWREAAEDALAAAAPLLSHIDHNELRFEIVLSLNLLCEPVDECLLSRDAIGAYWEVTIRLDERERSALSKRKWQHRSGLLHMQDKARPEQLVRLVDATAVPRREWRDPADEKVAVAIFASQHRPPSTWPARHVILDAIREGVPVLLWLRDDGDVGLLHDRVHATVSAAEPDRLPAEIRAMRTDAASVSLVYDDSQVRPIRGRSLRTPPQRRGAR
ncbi:hypothetical protein KZ829_25995 [Actinoplanes hulinensis]|uniref:vWA-MoxR associated protein C-terminal domain-containing protein n=1 Tax=Actinoplanes hulinensis TaxID=1144547 RepID=A0ABS7B805_9ACTN|nr:hypothetical protein [Actinoplanes hulinensis]MBW6437192.1 hypothetical protein [Actinoplanes hulinensis]